MQRQNCSAILCFEESIAEQAVPAEDFFLPTLERYGYCGAYFCKPCSPAEQYGAPCDGCALFYRSNRFAVCTEPEGETALTCCNTPLVWLAFLPGVVLCISNSLEACEVTSIHCTGKWNSMLLHGLYCLKCCAVQAIHTPACMLKAVTKAC